VNRDEACSPEQAYSDCRLTEALRNRARQRTGSRPEGWQQVLGRAGRVRLLLLDVDGVLTDGTIFFSGQGEVCKPFHTQDGFGLRLLREAGLQAGIVTARRSEAVAARAKNLRLDQVFLGVDDKAAALEAILADTGLSAKQVAYMGDDWLDLPLLTRVGLSLAPANGAPEVRSRVDYVTSRPGGQGAVREACELLLEGHGLLERLLRRYLGSGG